MLLESLRAAIRCAWVLIALYVDHDYLIRGSSLVTSLLGRWVASGSRGLTHSTFLYAALL